VLILAPRRNALVKKSAMARASSLAREARALPGEKDNVARRAY
jgi:hypothetical protein